MLTFEQKLAIIASFPELKRKDVSLGRVNFQYDESAYDKKNVIYHLHPNGNGFLFAGLLPDYDTDDKGFINIRDVHEDELRRLIRASIDSLKAEDASDAYEEEEAAVDGPTEQQRWIGEDGHVLNVYYEDELWYVFSGDNLESAFETYEETVEYLREEGFAREA